MLRCAASFVVAAYHKYASLLRICAPCLRTFYKAVRNSTFYEGIKFDEITFYFQSVKTVPTDTCEPTVQSEATSYSEKISRRDSAFSTQSAHRSSCSGEAETSFCFAQSGRVPNRLTSIRSSKPCLPCCIPSSNPLLLIYCASMAVSLCSLKSQ